MLLFKIKTPGLHFFVLIISSIVDIRLILYFKINKNNSAKNQRKNTILSHCMLWCDIAYSLGQRTIQYDFRTHNLYGDKNSAPFCSTYIRMYDQGRSKYRPWPSAMNFHHPFLLKRREIKGGRTVSPHLYSMGNGEIDIKNAYDCTGRENKRWRQGIFKQEISLYVPLGKEVMGKGKWICKIQILLTLTVTPNVYMVQSRRFILTNSV